MARIRKDDHARILALVDVERRAVREIAAEYGCTPAAIYALLTKLRRAAAGGAGESVDSQPPLALDPAVAPLAAALAQPAPPEERKVVTFERAAPPLARTPSALMTQPREMATRPEPRAEPGALGAKLARPGIGLAMRTADGEETVTPFRSVDDLLSAIKPILRASARSPEPVWFSLLPIDLSTIDVDAA